MNETKLHVAQFRNFFFNPTETFLYNYLISLERIVPVCISLQKKNANQFPFPYTITELYKWNSKFRRGCRRILKFFSPYISTTKYDLPITFEILQKYNVRLLHAHFGYTGSQVLPVKHKARVPLITTFYGEDVSKKSILLDWRRSYEKLFAEGELFLVEGPYMQKRLIEIGCPEDKIKIQHIAIDLRKYPFRMRLPKNKRELVRILFCGSFREKKGLLYALDAVRQVYTQNPRIEFIIIGDGELRPRVEEFLDRYQMRSYTHLLGFRPHSRMIEEMNAADLFIHPSITAKNGDSEGGAPTVILEAQACGLPVISTYHADIPNVVIPNESALLATERDSKKLMDNILLLLTAQDRWSTMGELGRAFVYTHHDILKEVKLLENRYIALAEANIHAYS